MIISCIVPNLILLIIYNKTEEFKYYKSIIITFFKKRLIRGGK